MRHWHIWEVHGDKWRCIEIKFSPRRGYWSWPCDLPLLWTSPAGRWQGDKYAPEGSCVVHHREKPRP